MENIDKNVLVEKIIQILKGSAISIGISLILLLIFAIILTYTNIGENTIKPVIIIISGIGILIGSGISTLKIKKNGMLNGGIIGFTYFFTIYLLSAITGSGFGMTIYSIIMLIACIITGMIGGIIGINKN